MANFYPSIAFSTKTIAPQPRELPWRSTIGIVGEFSRGPVGARRINADDIRTVYGYDASSGSVAAIQAMTMGAGEFVISRAVAGNTTANTIIQLASANPLNVPPQVGRELVADTDLNPTVDNINHTTGLSLDVNYVGNPLVTRTIYETIKTKAAIINHTKFTSEQANLYIFAVDFKQGGTTVRQSESASVLTVGVVTAEAGDHQIVKISTVDGPANCIDKEAGNILPGYRLENADNTVSLLILSKPYKLNQTEWGVLVENLSATTEGNITAIKIKDPVEDRYIFGYNFQTISGRALVPYTSNQVYFIKPNEVYDDGFNQNIIHSYFSVKAADGGKWIKFKYATAPSASLTNKTLLVLEDFGAGADEGVQILFGEEGQASNLQVALKGGFLIPMAVGSVIVGSKTDSVLAFTPGMSFADVLKALRAEIYSDLVVSSLINEAEVITTTYPYSINLVTALKGNDANRIFYKLTRYAKGTLANANDLKVRIDGTSYGTSEFGVYLRFKGAFVGPTGGYREFYSLNGTPIVRFTSVTPGIQNLRVTLQPSPMSSDDSPLMNVTISAVRDGESIIESGQIRMDTIDATSGLFLNTGLNTVNAYFIPLIEPAGGTIDPTLYTFLPLRVAPPLGSYSSLYNTGFTAISAAGTSVLYNVPFIGASNAEVGDQDSLVETRKQAYLEAVKTLAGENIAFLIIAGLPYGNSAYAEVFDAAIDQANRATPENGLRQVFFEAPYNMSPRQSNFISASIRNELVTLVNGHITMALGNGTYAARVGLTGYYAGLLSSRPPHIAPHANYGGQYLREVLNSTAKSDPDSKNLYSLGRVESLHFDRGLNRWKFLNGLTTSNDPTKRYVSVIRLRLQIMSDLQNYLQWVLSQPNTRALQRKVETAAATYMDSRLQEGWLLRLGSVVCNESNNSERDMSQGKLYLEISYVPIVPADFIFVTITEDYSLLDNLEFNTLPARS